MKRIIILFVLLLIPVFSFADPFFIDRHYSLFVDSSAVSSGYGESMFEFDSLCIDLYIMSDEATAFCSVSRTDNGFYLTDSNRYSVINDNGSVTFIADNGYYFTALYDENGTDLWINYDNRNYRLHPVAAFSALSDIR